MENSKNVYDAFKKAVDYLNTLSDEDLAKEIDKIPEDALFTEIASSFIKSAEAHERKEKNNGK